MVSSGRGRVGCQSLDTRTVVGLGTVGVVTIDGSLDDPEKGGRIVLEQNKSIVTTSGVFYN